MASVRKERLTKLQYLLSQLPSPDWRDETDCIFHVRVIEWTLATPKPIEELLEMMKTCVEKFHEGDKKQKRKAKTDTRKKLGKWVLEEGKRMKGQEKIRMSKWFDDAAQKESISAEPSTAMLENQGDAEDERESESEESSSD